MFIPDRIDTPRVARLFLSLFQETTGEPVIKRVRYAGEAAIVVGLDQLTDAEALTIANEICETAREERQ